MNTCIEIIKCQWKSETCQLDDRGYLPPDIPSNLGRPPPFTDSTDIMTLKLKEHLFTSVSAESAFSRHALFLFT